MSWPKVKSGKLFAFVTSGSRGWAKYYSDSGPAFLRVGNLDHNSISLDLRDIQRVQPPSGIEGIRTRVRPADILISITADVGMVGVVPEDFEEAYINQHVSLARPVSTVYPPYLAWCLSSPPAQQQFRELQRGATKVGLGLDDIRAVDVPLPPIHEQQRIVAEIEKQFTRLDAGVAALRRVQANLKRYRAAVLKAACEGRLAPTEAERARKEGRPFETGEALLTRILAERRQNWQGRGKYKDPSLPVPNNLPPIPEGWTWGSLDQLLSLLRNGISAKPDAECGLPILRISAVRALSVNLEEARHLHAEANDYSDYCLTEGDLLFTRYNGNPELVGVCGVVPTLTGPLVHPDKLIRCKLVASGALPKFVAIMVNVGASRSYLAKRVRTTAGQAGISGADLRGLPIPLPPLPEQKRIVAEVELRLSVVAELEAVVGANLQRATRLRQSILQKAFSGGLV